MAKRFLIGLLWVTGFAAHAQTINLRGKISNQAGQAVSGAIVELAVLKLKDTTASDGMYSFAGPTRIGSRSSAYTDRMALNGNVLELILSRSQPVTVEVFDVQGNLLRRQALADAPPGAHRWSVSENASPDNVLVVKVSVAGQARIFRHLPLAGGGYATRLPASGAAPMAARLAEAAAPFDTLKVTASGYAARKVQLSSYDTTIDVALQASSGDRWGGIGNPPLRSSGCGKPSLKSGTHTISSAGLQRQYILHMPANYDANKPSRLIFGMHWMNGSMQAVQSAKFYSYQTYDTGKTVILVAPQGYTDASPWRGRDDKDHVFFEDLHRHLLGSLCVDSSRVFMTGFSFGGMITNAISTIHQDRIRAAAGLGPANWNIYLPPRNHEPIPWIQTTGMSDRTTPWVNDDARKLGAKYIALEHAADNGCAIPAGNNIPIWKSGPHFCYDFQGCKAGYPVKVCTFGGVHTDINSDPGSSVNWLHTESWQFFLQF